MMKLSENSLYSVSMGEFQFKEPSIFFYAMVVMSIKSSKASMGNGYLKLFAKKIYVRKIQPL